MGTISSARSASPSADAFPLDQTYAIVDSFRRCGYAVVRDVFEIPEIDRLRRAAERTRQRGLSVGRSYRQGNVGCWIRDDANVGRHVLALQWPSYHETDLEQHRRDPRMLDVLEPLIGRNVRQIVNQLHWKTPRSTFAVSFHRDRDNRRPADAYRRLATSYVQTATVIDPMVDDNGPLLLVPGSHLRKPKAGGRRAANFVSGRLSKSPLTVEGYDDTDLVTVRAEPGDVVLWHVDTIHGSEMNESDRERCLYINGYVDARGSMRGHWAFIEGAGVPLPPADVPVLIHRDDIFAAEAGAREFLEESVLPTD